MAGKEEEWCGGGGAVVEEKNRGGACVGEESGRSLALDWSPNGIIFCNGLDTNENALQ
jgi:hypothetical protein